MRRYTFCLMAVLAVAVAVTSCRDMETDMINPNIGESMYTTNTYAGQFKRVWQGIDVGYAFWKWDKVDWDSVYRTDLPIFEEADRCFDEYKDTMKLDRYRELWESIIMPLADNHMSLAVRDPHSKDGVAVSPAFKRQKSRDYHLGFNMSQHLAVLRSMLGSGELNAELRVDSTTDDQKSKAYVISGMINDHIAYLYMSSYMINLKDSATCANLKALFADVRRETEAGTLKGFIMDTRNNRGGYSNWQNYIGSWFVQEDLTVCYEYMKKDVGRYDYAAPIAYVIRPNSDNFLRQMSDDCPLVCLFDQNSASNGEEIPWMLSKMPGYASVGERTYGGMGGLILNAYTPFFAGTFGNADILTSSKNGNYYCYMSLFAHVDAQTGECPEGIGMIPQIEEVLDTKAFFAGKRDNQLLRAIQRVETGK